MIFFFDNYQMVQVTLVTWISCVLTHPVLLGFEMTKENGQSDSWEPSQNTRYPQVSTQGEHVNVCVQVHMCVSVHV